MHEPIMLNYDVLSESYYLILSFLLMGPSARTTCAQSSGLKSNTYVNTVGVFIRGYVTNLGNGAVQEISYPETNGHNGGTRAVHRKALLKALEEELPNNSIRFSCKITGIETQSHEGSSIAVVDLEDGTSIKAKVLIGCDGVHSVVASWLGLASPVHSGRSAVRGLAAFPQGHGLVKQDVYQFVGAGLRAGFAPLTDKDIYWALDCASPANGAYKGDPIAIQREVIENYAKDLPELYLDIVKHSDLSTLSWAPLVFRQPWNVAFGNLSNQNVTVAGDAMHPMTPDLGQGGCLALEDAVVLGRHIGRCVLENGELDSREIARALADYAKERRSRAAWLITGSFFSGWVQHGGSLVLKFLRDSIFYKFVLHKLFNATNYDCGKLT
ncbi:Zeaxanthin epoxidase [Morus notabilis]|uniref:Zeaxanthin epoxidase n=1 Tax=Morus notabilis TaxID=981085 RepID=W9R2B4_9ROSA|nr:Zeaxanthin epoxidase [Morus notabilis]